MYIIIIASVLGVVLVISGLLYPVYSFPDDFYGGESKITFSCTKKVIQSIEKLIVPPAESKVYKTMGKLISFFDVDITVSRLWFYKILCISLSFIILTIVSVTNSVVLKMDIMGTWRQDSIFMNTITQEEYKYNVSVYKEVLSKIGEENLKKLTDGEKLKKISVALNEIRGGTIAATDAASGRAEAFMAAYEDIENIKIITVNVILVAIISFFIPDILLALRKIIIGKKYKNEAIKMENIFGLLGTMENYKTIYIINDLAMASKLFNKQLKHASTIFYTDKSKCFEYLRGSIKERSFTRLVDVLRIYSTVDKKLALTILERNLKEHEEQLLLSAEEDMDVVDIIAFISVVPILYEVGNLMVSPMLETIFKVFSFM